MSQQNRDPKNYQEGIDRLKQRITELESQIGEGDKPEDADSDQDSILYSLYKAMTEGMALHSLVFDESGKAVDYVILEVNPAYERITGLSRERAIGLRASDLYTTGEAPYLDIYTRVAQGGKPEAFETYFPPMDKHFKVKVFSPSANSFATVFEDVTDQVLSQQKLKESELLFRTITETALDSIFVKDTERRYTFVNPAMCKLFNVKSETLLGRTPEELFDPESAAKVTAVDKPVLEGRVVNEVATIQLGESMRAFNTLQVPLKNDEGTVVGMVGIVRDVTEQRQKEDNLRHLQKLESIGTLAGGVAHEINNPINIVINFAELIQGMSEPDGTVADYTGEIIKESHRIADIVSSLLVFSRQDHESHSPARMQDIVDSTLSLTRKILEKDGIRVETDLQPDLPKCKCRHQQIMQVLMNLITNARDALNQKYPEHDPSKVIRLSCRMDTREDRRWLRITVADSGGGIPEQLLDKIFDPFFTSKDRSLGTGLGLAISHGIVKDHHGDLTVESSDGLTRFHMDLPLDNGWRLSTESDDQ